DRVAPFTSDTPPGVTLVAAQGVNLPFGPNDSPESGTSMATPIVVSIAALMLKTNPKLTPDEVERILGDSSVAHDIPGTTRDGKGIVDVVAAVKKASQ